MSFFFQAEDGIRDWSVTGVQTCALPIFDHDRRPGSAAGSFLARYPRHIMIDRQRIRAALVANSRPSSWRARAVLRRSKSCAVAEMAMYFARSRLPEACRGTAQQRTAGITRRLLSPSPPAFIEQNP